MNNVKGSMYHKIKRDHFFKNREICTVLYCFFLVLFSGKINAQQVEAAVDTSEIKIGEQINYSIAVETGEDDLVVFPEGQTFSPLEMIESFPIDTIQVEDRLKLLKEYALTQFDSGSYTIPQQRVLINGRDFLTDSIPVVVNNVVVDTTKQKLYPIKPSVEVPPAFVVPQWLWWVLGILVLLGLVAFLIYEKKKKMDREGKKLPPYEQAISELKRLDDSHLLENREIKEYYSQLSAAVRRYLDEEIYDHAMESTTSELIAYLETERATGKVKLEDSTINRLKKILERSDLTKFANSRPDVLTAREDRSSVEEVINETKASIPQPTEEELLKDKEYREKIARKKKVRKIVAGIIIAILLLGAGTAYIISTRGFEYFTDTYVGNQSKDLLEGEWIRSEYGTPPVTITTPDVLLRDLPEQAALAAAREAFRYGSIESRLFIGINTRPVGQDFELKAALEEVYTYLEERGAKNIITKQEEIETLNGAEGLRVFGTFTFGSEGEQVQKEYSILNFGEAGGYQQIVVIYEEEDRYADEIMQRITSSVELVNADE